MFDKPKQSIIPDYTPLAYSIIGAKKQREATERRGMKVEITTKVEDTQLVKMMLDAGVPLKTIRTIPRDYDYVRKYIARYRQMADMRLKHLKEAKEGALDRALEDFREEEGI